MNFEFFNQRKFMMTAFAIVAAAQLAVPAAMIVRYESVLAYGTLYKFRTAPVDPYDAFRGRYVALRIKEDTAKVKNKADFRYQETVYATLETDPDGFAKFATVTKAPPAGKVDYIKVKVRYTYSENDNVISLDVPFDRYYMNENFARAAETAYRENSRRGKENTYIAVRVLDGKAVIVGLFIDNKPIEQYLKEK